MVMSVRFRYKLEVRHERFGALDELLGQPSPGATQPGSGGLGRAIQDGGYFGRVQTVPAGQEQDFAVIVTQVAQCLQEIGPFHRLGGAVGAGQLIQPGNRSSQTLSPSARAPVIGQHLPGSAEQPRQWFGWELIEVSPSG